VHNQSIRQPRATTVLVGPAILILGTAWLAGCAQQQAHSSGSWEANATHGQAFQKVLVVGVSPNVNARCAFERFLVSRIQSGSTTAISSCDVVAEKNPLTRESIEAAVASTQADAVVATILVSREWATKQGGSRDTRGSAQYKATDSGWATGYYGAYGVPVVYGDFATAPPIDVANGEVTVMTKVFETRGPTLVYTMDTSAKGLESSDTTLAVVTTPIADKLRREGLIR
jgi:hypothetical protein